MEAESLGNLVTCKYWKWLQQSCVHVRLYPSNILTTSQHLCLSQSSLSLSLSLSLSSPSPLSPPFTRPLPRGLTDYGEVVQVIHMTLVAMMLYAGLLSWRFNWEVGCTYALQVSIIPRPNILCVPWDCAKNRVWTLFTRKTGAMVVTWFRC